MPRFARTLARGLALAATLAAAACNPPEDGCLAGDDGHCLPKSPCAGLHMACGESRLEIRQLASPNARPAGTKADAARGDIVLANGLLSAVLGGIENPRGLAPSGGGLIDLVPTDPDAVDELNQAFQAVGILPDDAARYTSVDWLDQAPELVAAVFRGHLDLRPEVEIVTRYELRACEPGLRVRSEIYQGSRDPLTVFPADALFWGDRSLTPFVPVAGGGYSHPTLDLETLGDAFRDGPFVAADAHTEHGAAYAVVACDAAVQSGFHSETLSAVGAERSILMPGDSVAFERFIAVAKGPGQQRATDLAFEVRAQLFGELTTHVSGRLRTGGAGSASGERRVSLLFSELLGDADGPAATRVPWAEAVPDERDEFELRLPRNKRFVVQRFAFGRELGERLPFTTDRDELELGALDGGRPGTLTVNVTRADGAPLIAELTLVPRAPTTADAVRGSQFGVFAEERCAPYLGPPHAGSPACNRVLVDSSGSARFDVPAGNYFVYASHGPFWSLSRAPISVSDGTELELTLALEPLPILPEGVLSADFHVHGGASYDSSLPDRDRALSFVAMGVDVIAATDHDVVSDYGRALRELGLAEHVRVMPGVETTGQILFLRPPGSNVPRVIGHFNFWPLQRNPSLPRNGAPDDERLEPGALFDRVDRLYDGTGVAQLNHPFLPSDLGRDTGYLAALEYDPRRAVPAQPDGSHEGELARRPAHGHKNLDFDAQEVMNGTSVEQMLRYRAGWFSFLNQGILRAGTANSDSHTLATDVLGYPRNLVFGGHSLSNFDRERFNRSVRQGEMLGTNGPVLDVCLVDAEHTCARPSLSARTPSSDAHFQILLRAAPFVPIDELRFIVNGSVRKTISLTPIPELDPFGTSDLTRFEGSVELSELGSPGRDLWLVIEAGLRLPLAGDLEDDDGLPDTTDNNGDGRVDAADGPGEFHEPGRVSEQDPRFHLETLAPGAWSTAFSNPFLIDWDGDGWLAPGLP